MEENQSILELQVDQTASKNLSDATTVGEIPFQLQVFLHGLMVIIFLLQWQNLQITIALSQVIPGFSGYCPVFGFLMCSYHYCCRYCGSVNVFSFQGIGPDQKRN